MEAAKSRLSAPPKQRWTAYAAASGRCPSCYRVQDLIHTSAASRPACDTTRGFRWAFGFRTSDPMVLWQQAHNAWSRLPWTGYAPCVARVSV